MKVDDGERVGYLLHYIGESAFNNICDSYGNTNPYVQYDVLKNKFESLFALSILEIAENLKFNCREQEAGEEALTYANFSTKIRSTYDFGNFHQTALRNQFVVGLASESIQSRFLEKKELTFATALQTATSIELTSREARTMKNGTASLHYLHAHGSKEKKPSNYCSVEGHTERVARAIQR